MGAFRLNLNLMIRIKRRRLSVVKVWDTVGNDQVLKGEYKAISGPVSVMFKKMYSRSIPTQNRSVGMIWNGMVKVSVSSLWGTVETSRRLGSVSCRFWEHLWQGRFGHAFMMDTGSSTGEITGHSKVRPTRFVDISGVLTTCRLSMRSRFDIRDLTELLLRETMD